MNCICLLFLGATLTASLSTLDARMDTSNEKDDVSAIRENFPDFQASFKENTGNDWTYGNPVDEKPILNENGDRFGTVLRFERCYLCLDSLNHLVHTEWGNGAPYKWKESKAYIWRKEQIGLLENGIFRSISKDSEKGFGRGAIREQFHQIQYTSGFNNYKTKYVFCDFHFFDKSVVMPKPKCWQTICTEQIGPRCFLHAMANLLFTYKFSTTIDATNGLNAFNLPNKLEEYAPVAECGNSEITFAAQMNDFLSATGTGAYLNPASDGMGFAPYIANYRPHGNVIDGHAAMVIGEGVSGAWWIFKTNWDIVLTWVQNFYFPGMRIDKSDYRSIHVVDRQYQKARWCLCKNQKLITIND